MLSIKSKIFSPFILIRAKDGSSSWTSMSGSTTSGLNSVGWTSVWFPVSCSLVGWIMDGGGTL